MTFLDSGYGLLDSGVERLEEGTIDQSNGPSAPDDRELRRHAVAVVIAHDHPNGDSRPEHDRVLTRAIVPAAAAGRAARA